MKGYIQHGKSLTLTAPVGGVVSGAGLFIGSSFGVAVISAPAGQDFEFLTEGVVILPKATGEAFTEGQLLFWNGAALTGIAQSSGRVGFATAAAATAATAAIVKLCAPPQVAVLRGSASLNFPSIAAAAQADLTLTIAGAAINDNVALGLPAAPTAGIFFNAFVSAVNTVTIRASNITGAAIDPPALTYSVAILKA
jgi:predicted RecA/RadA family phage recombinase